MSFLRRNHTTKYVAPISFTNGKFVLSGSFRLERNTAAQILTLKLATYPSTLSLPSGQRHNIIVYWRVPEASRHEIVLELNSHIDIDDDLGNEIFIDSLNHMLYIHATMMSTVATSAQLL